MPRHDVIQPPAPFAQPPAMDPHGSRSSTQQGPLGCTTSRQRRVAGRRSGPSASIPRFPSADAPSPTSTEIHNRHLRPGADNHTLRESIVE